MDAAVHPEMSNDTPPNIFYRSITAITFTVEYYGWYILGAIILISYAWSKIKPQYEKWIKAQEDNEFYSRYHKDPDLYQARIASQEAARLRMQEKYSEDAAVAEEKRKIMEQKKREEFIEHHTGISRGYRLGDTESTSQQSNDSTTKKKSLRPNFFPLSGHGVGESYRPSRRSCPGGGCG